MKTNIRYTHECLLPGVDEKQRCLDSEILLSEHQDKER